MNGRIAEIQTLLGVVADNIWGPRSQAALIEASDEKKKEIQELLGVPADGLWGPLSQGALNRLSSTSANFVCKASSFADPADLQAFKACKRTGASDVHCFSKGDNGIGVYGKITAQEEIPMVAVHKDFMVARWGSVEAAAHRPVQLTVDGVTISATVEDRISEPGRIDLNPACAKQLHLHPPFVKPCTWRWA